ncbi:MAG: AAA family ATPase [Planctomycetaceae bacterium]|jgi:ABC-type cobalamin/Fe3+-siderophores transport system ATPase subunit|nr:AAA family ATPase [Planctomycetaceae bacterium]
MAIEQIEIDNLLVFSNNKFSMDFCKGINVFIGSNGSGKTTLLKLLYAACNRTHEKISQRNKQLYEFFSTNSEDKETKTIWKTNAKYCLKIDGVTLKYRNDETTFTVTEENRKIFETNIQSVYIPTTEMLSHSKGFLAMNEKYKMPFDVTQTDIIVNAELPETRKISTVSETLLAKIRKIIDGEVLYENDTFYIVKSSGQKIAYPYEAEGFRKMGLLWKLIRNGLLESGSILFWDEPECNINPEHLPVLVDILLTMQRNNVQIFVATHNYNLARYFDVLRQKNDDVIFYNLSKHNHTVRYDKSAEYVKLASSVLDEADQALFDAVAKYMVEKTNDKNNF